MVQIVQHGIETPQLPLKEAVTMADELLAKFSIGAERPGLRVELCKLLRDIHRRGAMAERDRATMGEQAGVNAIINRDAAIALLIDKGRPILDLYSLTDGQIADALRSAVTRGEITAADVRRVAANYGQQESGQ